MPAYKDSKNNTWFVQFTYVDWTGKTKGVTKRGFSTKREASQWEAERRKALSGSIDMTLEDFIRTIYLPTIEKRVRPSTYNMKINILEKHIIPWLGQFKINELESTDILKWQDKIMSYRNPKTGAPYTPSYSKTINIQLTAVISFACKHYHLPSNPAIIAGSMGDNKHMEIDFWTLEEYKEFSEVMMDKPIYFMAYEMLYWTGCRLGELLALDWGSVDLNTGMITITKTYQVIKGKGVIGPTKTPKGMRAVQIPEFLCEELRDFWKFTYKPNEDDRLFWNLSKTSLNRELKRGAKLAGVKPIHVHCLRHSHVSLLINNGFDAVSIGTRIGHKSIDITYRYAHMFPSTQGKLVKCLENLNNEDVYNDVGKAIRQKR